MRYLSLYIFLCVSGCGKDSDGLTNSEAFLINKTTHTIEIRPYSNGVLKDQYVITLAPNDSIQIANSFSMGKDKGYGGFDSEYFRGSDSLNVIFDNAHIIAHYLFEPPGKREKHSLYTSNRNLLGAASYQTSTIKETKSSIFNHYKYFFTEQDYLDAQ